MMRPSLGLLLLLLSGLGLSVHGSEIINGKKVPEAEMKYMASVQDAKGKHLCGGFLISEDVVVTAAHCEDESTVESVVLGTHDLNNRKMTIRYNVTKCKHRSYTEAKKGSDIMLLQLSEKVPRNIKRIKPIKLPKAMKTKDMKIKDNSKCWVTGWGATKDGGNPVKQLERVKVHYLNLKSCQEKWKNYSSLPKNVICAGGFTEDKKGFCKGDSGGPLVCNGKAVGIVSFNYHEKCDYPNLPNVYTNLSKYLYWIKQFSNTKKCRI